MGITTFSSDNTLFRHHFTMILFPLMQILSKHQHQQRITGGRILEADGHGPKVLLLEDGTIAKLFRRRSGFTSDKLRPYSVRFIRNAHKLKRAGIATLSPLEHYRVQGESLDVVIYQPLVGTSLKEICRDQPQSVDGSFAARLGVYIGQLHNQGIYFRSLHLGNILQLPDGSFGLIDIADLKVQTMALSSWQRLRNFKHMVRMKEFSAPLKAQATTLIESYLDGYKSGSHQFEQKITQMFTQW